jgi:two-component system, sensor histidine kinase and response regulator
MHHPLPTTAALFDHLADAVYLLDPESSNIVWGNRCAWESLGLTREQVLDHSVLSLQMDVTGLPQWSDIAAVIRATPCYTFVGRHRHAQGHEVAVEVNTTRFHDQGREYFLSVARDISRRTALEAELKKRENQLWFALNEAMDGLWDWDVLTNEVFFSPQLKRMLGYGPDEMVPEITTWSHNIHPDDAGRVLGLCGSTSKAGAPATRPSTACATATAAGCGCTTAAVSASAMPPACPRAWSAWCRT